ncbi:ankyrin repeat domain-containing protein [Sansalvadorimonas verongulae]|uniref:ankyrin repeat domain-containing protein n=1 Tax=Sansalvadorimonas verongulae TaxID=2172824 RepID=UPI0012BC7FA2|nr:ankyrin repeat domain-containing protein [Sansalvadorimonas verongulae]MTI13663.1 ankyrin repeat domain-containing protein [Sansalvadorimonas verongulae]
MLRTHKKLWWFYASFFLLNLQICTDALAAGECNKVELKVPLVNKYGEHDFLAACREGNLEAVNVFLSQGDFDINKYFPNRGSGTHVHGLFMATIKGHAEVVQRLVDAGAQVNKKCWGYTVLFAAAYTAHIDVIKVLLKTKNIDVDQVQDGKEHLGATALIQAIKDGHVEMVKLLLETGADPSKEWYVDENFSRAPLTLAKLLWYDQLFFGSRNKRLEYTQIIDYLKQASQVHTEQRQAPQRRRNTKSVEVTAAPSQEAIEMSIFNVQSGSKK